MVNIGLKYNKDASQNIDLNNENIGKQNNE